MKGRGLTVNVKVGDATLAELAGVSRGDKASCFIVSSVGTSFEVFVENQAEEDARFAIFVDGEHVHSRIVRPSVSSTVEGVNPDEDTLRPFVFAELRLTDDETALFPDQENLEHLGTIRVDVHRGVQGESVGYRGGTYDRLEDSRAVHERTKKAGTHKVKLGDPVPCTRRRAVKFDYIDDAKGPPYMQFTFRYRPQALLQALGYLPADTNLNANGRRPRSPGEESGSARNVRQRAESEQPPQDDDGPEVKEEADIDDLRAARAALDARIRVAERQLVKREPSPIVLGGPSGVTIDLTLDD